MTKHNKSLRFTFIAAFIFLLVLSVVTYTRLTSLIESGQLVNHTTDVNLEFEKTIGSLKDAETGQRGFLLTHYTQFLEKYNKGIVDYSEHMQVLKELIKGNSEQKKHLQRLQVLAERRIKYMEKMLDVDKLRTPTGPEMQIGESIMDSLRSQVKTMITIENSLMQQRIKQLEKQMLLAPAMIFVLSMIAFSILIISYWQLNKSLLRAQYLQQEVIDKNVRIEKSKLIEANEKELQLLIKQAPVAITLWEGSSFIVKVANETALALMGKTEQEIINKPLSEFVGTLPQRQHVCREVFHTGIPYTEREVEIVINRSGENFTRYYDLNYTPWKSSNDKIKGVMGLGLDVTEKVLSRKKIEESEERFRSLAQTLPQLVWLTDEEGNMEFASSRWKEYSGIEPCGEEEWKAIVHPDDYDPINAAWLYSLRTGNIYKFDVRLKNKNGEYRWHKVRGEAVLDKNNKIAKWVGALTDIHTEKTFTQQLEIQVQERTKELNQKNIDLEKMNKELESFAYISSHDLQEPLRKIQTFSTRIMEKDGNSLSENAKDYFKRMQNASERMQTLINDLLTYSRTNTTQRKFEIIHLNTIIEEVVEDLQEELKEKHAIIEATDLCDVNIIPFQFRQLMHNLIGNSLKFSRVHQPPIIKITCHKVAGTELKHLKIIPQKEYYHLSIVDNGIGFETEYSERIFEVFQRLHGRSEYPGTGIGLSIVKKIVENHNGVITAQGELGVGARFDIYFPT